MLGTIGQTDDLQGGGSIPLPLGPGESGEEEREFHIALRGQHGQQIVELENKTHVF
jgi:hypothetical protein